MEYLDKPLSSVMYFLFFPSKSTVHKVFPAAFYWYNWSAAKCDKQKWFCPLRRLGGFYSARRVLQSAVEWFQMCIIFTRRCGQSFVNTVFHFRYGVVGVWWVTVVELVVIFWLLFLLLTCSFYTAGANPAITGCRSIRWGGNSPVLENMPYFDCHI